MKHPSFFSRLWLAFGLALPTIVGCGIPFTSNSEDQSASSNRQNRDVVDRTVPPIRNADDQPIQFAAKDDPKTELRGKEEDRKDPNPKEDSKNAENPGKEDPNGEQPEAPPEAPPPIPKNAQPFPKGSKAVFFEKMADDSRRVHVMAEVCLREGQLEVLLCKKQSKEHEAIMFADVDARDIHFALIAAKATPGSTVKFSPKYQAATGSKIKVSLTYHLKGKLRTELAQSWIKDVNTKKDMRHEWVFAGSRFFKFPDDPDRPPFYCANNGEVISVANFPDSMLDLPIRSSSDQSQLNFEVWTERVPPKKTKVLITLEPVIENR